MGMLPYDASHRPRIPRIRTARLSQTHIQHRGGIPTANTNSTRIQPLFHVRDNYSIQFPRFRGPFVGSTMIRNGFSNCSFLPRIRPSLWNPILNRQSVILHGVVWV